MDKELAVKLVLVESNYARNECVMTVMKIWTVDNELAVKSVFVENDCTRNEYVCDSSGNLNGG